MSDYGPSILLATLYERTSAKGTRYFTGRLGAAKVAILPSKDKADDGTPDMAPDGHSEAPAKQDRPSDAAKAASQAPPTERRVEQNVATTLNDEIPF